MPVRPGDGCDIQQASVELVTLQLFMLSVLLRVHLLRLTPTLGILVNYFRL